MLPLTICGMLSGEALPSSTHSLWGLGVGSTGSFTAAGLRRHSIDLNGNVSPKSALSSSRNEVVPHINIRSPRLQPGKFVIGETKKTFATKTARSGHGHA
jgi:hypothetical protein